MGRQALWERSEAATHATWSSLMSMSSTIRLTSPGVSIPTVHQSGSPAKPFGLLGKLGLWLERKRQRDALADLADDKHLLDDIGLTREEALYESGRRFWR